MASEMQRLFRLTLPHSTSLYLTLPHQLTFPNDHRPTYSTPQTAYLRRQLVAFCLQLLYLARIVVSHLPSGGSYGWRAMGSSGWHGVV